MAYVDCPSCGKTALSVASRCPHCGLLFSPGVLPPVEPSRFPRPLVVAGAVVVLVAAVVLVQNWIEATSAPSRRAVEALAPAVRQPQPPATVIAPSTAVESLRPAPDSAADSTPPPAAVTPQAVPREAIPRQAAPQQAAPPPTAPTGEQLQRYAMTWVNVRGRRSPDAAPVRVLDPGEAVLVDSLVGGWYRVVIDGQAIGYAYGSNLIEEAP